MLSQNTIVSLGLLKIPYNSRFFVTRICFFSVNCCIFAAS